MTFTAHDAYRETEIRTATPQKLRLMLIDGALRFARLAIECWDTPTRQETRCNALARCHDILTELYASIRADAVPVARQVKSIYQFLFRHLADATLSNDRQKLQEVVGVLEEERETWRQVCEVMPEPPERPEGGLGQMREITARDCPMAPPAPSSRDGLPPMERISFQA
jgi:flagellar secretion chaperone FliS